LNLLLNVCKFDYKIEFLIRMKLNQESKLYKLVTVAISEMKIKNEN